MTTPPSTVDFYGLGIAPKLLDILDQLKFKVPTPIQVQSIPIAVTGKDIMGIAQTGTGKTLAFGIPLLQRLAQGGGRGLVILPTRELALQVEETLQKIGRSVGLRTAVLIGGAAMHGQLIALRAKPHILIVTPGRLIDHLEQKTINLNDVKVLVLDEADRMLDMGFAPQLKRIMTTVPKERQTMLFSATMPQAIMAMANTFMNLPVRVEIARAGTTADRVTQELFFVRKEDKLRLLQKLLTEKLGSVLVFSRTKHGAKRITHAIQRMGHTSAEIHSNRSLAQRKEALSGFKSGKYRVLVATDIAARGIDVTNIEVVINYDLPDVAEDYVHRIGRTGRAGHSGHAISFATPDQARDVRDIERLTRVMLPVSKLPELPPPLSLPPMQEDAPRFGRPAPRGGSSYGKSSGPRRSSSFGSSFGRSSSAPAPRAASASAYSARPATGTGLRYSNAPRPSSGPRPFSGPRRSSGGYRKSR